MGRELDYEKSRKLALKIIDIFKEDNLSPNQVVQILDLVKEILSNRPLWISK